MKELTIEEMRVLCKADKAIRKKSKGAWPKYAMISWRPDENEEEKKPVFHTFGQAAQLYDSGQIQVERGQHVLYEDLSYREMTDYDKFSISDAADEYSASK